MTRSDIGDYLGLRIETVSRTFTQLRTAKLIANTAAGGVAILDANALAELAAGG
jgi:CRP/FNR family transcriptional regulator